jgi:SEC-C motif-containing protein
MRNMPDNTPCPCGLAQPYRACCARWHSGDWHLQAPDAQALMRSRYSAYVLGLTAYLQDTWHPSTRPAELQLAPGLRWLGLTVKRHALDGPGQATVEFVARSKQAGRAHRLHETSRFVQMQGRWFYLDGQIHSTG